jgi:phosphopantetheine--protein transferase-like protein
MIGNDIIDLKQATVESNCNKKGFVEKIFTQKEQDYINTIAQPHQAIWRLWSMKEAAYKIYSRQNKCRFFAPKKINCSIINNKMGNVLINNKQYLTNTITCTKYIYTIAKPIDCNSNTILHCCFYHPSSNTQKQSSNIYNLIMDKYAILKNKNSNTLFIKKDTNGIPFLYCTKSNELIPISITHHGHYAAFIIN